MLLQILLAFTAFYLWYFYKFSYWKEHGFPYVAGKFPLGSGSDTGRKEHICDFLKREYEKLKNKGPAFGIYFFAKPFLVLTDPDLIRDIFVKNFENFNERGLTFCEEADPLSQHLFFKNGQEWKNLRAKLSQIFTSGKMKMMFPNIARNTEHMIEHLNSICNASATIEMKEVFSSLSSEIIADVLYGLEINCIGNPQNEFRKMGNVVFEPTTFETLKFFFMMSFEKLSIRLKLGLNRQSTIDFFMGVIKDTLEFREKNNVERNDFLQLLINMKNSEEGMTFNEIAAVSFGFFIAGFETSSTLMTFCAYELALNQNIQTRLRDEINNVVKQYNDEITYESIFEMKYLDMVVCEALRKYPVIDVQRRKSIKDFKISNSNLVIPAGTLIMIPTYALHTDDRFWENPTKFDPERFTNENIQKRHPFTYIPFSEGPRICIGLRFGQLQTKLGIVKLLKNFRILPCNKTEIPVKFLPSAVFQTPLGGMWLTLEKL